MKTSFDQPMFIFEMANNHMGDLSHGKDTIRAFAKIADDFNYRFAFKFQFRHIDTFIHPDYHQRTDIKYVKRFKETALTESDFKILRDEALQHNFVTICTPFDEPSVDLIESLDIEIIKIASCSFTDWPLLERIVQSDKPIIASTAGATLDDIDKVVSFFQHRDKTFALMHCVGEYPTEVKNLQMNQIDLLKQRYADIPIGFSTHESPENHDAVKIAIAKGAMLFERHVALDTEKYPKNSYSSTPEQIRKWMMAADRAYCMCGVTDQRAQPSQKELADLHQFKRGAFVKQAVADGENIQRDNLFYAFPNQQGQLLANHMSKYIEFQARQNIADAAPLMCDQVHTKHIREEVYSAVQKVKEILSCANVVVPGKAELELSHHYGIDKFYEFGCTLINVVNRDYCKKLIVVLPGQHHPEQYHKIKEETFLVLYGDVLLTLDDIPMQCKTGDIITVDQGTKHIFSSKDGAIIEEISSTHYKNDSYYTDESILKNKNRKTVLSFWMD